MLVSGVTIHAVPSHLNTSPSDAPLISSFNELTAASFFHVPEYIKSDAESVSNTSNPVAGDAIAFRCTAVMRGISRPLEVLWMSSMALASGGALLGLIDTCAWSWVMNNTPRHACKSFFIYSNLFSLSGQSVRLFGCGYRYASTGHGKGWSTDNPKK